MSHGDTFNQTNSLTQDILQQRLNETMTMTTSPLVAPPSRSAQKILFGIPDPDLPGAVLARLCRKQWAGFCDRWNVDPQTGRPGSTDSEDKLNWSLVSTDDPETIATETKLATTPSPKALDASTVTVQLDAVAVVMESSTVSLSIQSAEVNQHSTPSSSGLAGRNLSPGPGGKRFCSGIGSGAKQRSITDYMKEKKKPFVQNLQEKKLGPPLLPLPSAAGSCVAMDIETEAEEENVREDAMK